MPGSIQFLTVDELLAIHDRLIEKFGGTGGLIDGGLLESALFRPQTGYYADVIEMSAAMFESLLMNHPFVDGNKRIAFFATDIFLRLNGYRIVVDADEAHALLIDLIERRECNFSNLAPWLRHNVRRL